MLDVINEKVAYPVKKKMTTTEVMASPMNFSRSLQMTEHGCCDKLLLRRVMRAIKGYQYQNTWWCAIPEGPPTDDDWRCSDGKEVEPENTQEC